MLTIKDARFLSKKIIETSSKVQGVELFGSVLKNGSGHDVDLILIVNDNLSHRFWSVTADIIPKWPARLMWFRNLIKFFLPFLDQAFIWRRKRSRQLRASNLIGLDLARLAEQYRPGTIIDVWLMPDNWQLRIVDITDNKNMTLFLKAAASSALKIA